MGLSYPTDQDRRHGKVQFTFKPHPNNPGNAPPAGGFGGADIILPLPPSVNLGDTMEYDNYNARTTGQLVESMMKGEGGQFAQKIRERYTNTDTGKIDLDKLKSDLVSKMGTAVMRNQEGMTAHPDTRSIFKQPNLREMSFEFKLVALQGSDSLLIKSIIKKFREHMHPEKDGDEDDPNLFYILPDLVTVEMFLGGQKIPPNFKDMYMTSFNVTYGGQVLAEYDANHWFSETTISMTLRESETLTRQRVEAGF